MARRTQTNGILSQFIRFIWMLILVNSLKNVIKCAKGEENVTALVGNADKNVTYRPFRQLNALQHYKCTDAVTNNTCTCIAPCMEYKNGTDYCVVKNCYEYDPNTKLCAKSGKSWMVALCLQIFTTSIGGTAFLQQWGWFAAVMCLVFGPCLLRMFLGCCVKEEDSVELLDLVIKILQGLCTFAYLIIWIYLLVKIAENDIEGPDGCPMVK